VKRITVHVFNVGEFGLALSVSKYLKHHGVNALIVTKHALQIHPDHRQKAAQVLSDYRWAWNRSRPPAAGTEAREIAGKL